jgi:hypothetical protein
MEGGRGTLGEPGPLSYTDCSWGVSGHPREWEARRRP